ncbi:MAG: hypothetical protein U9N02_08285 [Campylobacterota bacterium]|nr:hypothetical protein [Campylobacterota bacterium]
MKKYLLLLSAFVLIIFSGCSSKEVFEPKSVKDDWNNHYYINQNIIDTSSTVALLDDGSILSKSERIDMQIDNEHRLISKSDGWIISSRLDGQTTIQYIGDKTLNKTFDLKKTVATAGIKDDVLAILFADNEMALYKISTGELVLKEQGNAPIAVDSRMANPFFMNDLVLFSTLDGKIVIINSKLKKKLRTVIVSTDEYFNNIIYFDVVDSKLIVASPHKLISMSQKEVRLKYEIRNVTYDNKNIYLTTKQGEVISLTPNLQINAKLKFPFAHFLGLIATNDKVYALEKEGYIIEMSKDLLEYNVYEVDINDGYVFVGDKVFFVDDKAISVDAKNQ